MKTPLSAALSFVATQEGGYSSDRNDPGNWTTGVTGMGRFVGSMRGISAPTLIQWLGPENEAMVTPAMMRGLSQDIVNSILTRNYWSRMACGYLPPGVDLMVFDHGVNAGPVASVRLLQQAAGMKIASIDGRNGPHTQAATWLTGTRMIDALSVWQQNSYCSMRDFPTYGAAWLARLQRRTAAAKASAALSAQPGGIDYEMTDNNPLIVNVQPLAPGMPPATQTITVQFNVTDAASQSSLVKVLAQLQSVLASLQLLTQRTTIMSASISELEAEITKLQASDAKLTTAVDSAVSDIATISAALAAALASAASAVPAADLAALTQVQTDLDGLVAKLGAAMPPPVPV